MRPSPPGWLLNAYNDRFAVSPDLHDWARETFIDDGARLENLDHIHLRLANVGFLWTNACNARQGRSIVGTAEPGLPSAIGRWPRARAVQQVAEWFGLVPDFIVTLSAPYAEQVGDAEFCSLVEHELYHCAQARDVFGAPKFRKNGKPVFEMRGHDVEEFVGIVRRYGVGAAAGDTLALVEAARSAPEIAASTIAGVCGTCLAKA